MKKNNNDIIKNDNKKVLSIKNVNYRYRDAEKDDYVLRDINFDFEKGKVYAIKGKSGSGKTTLLSLISGLEKKYEGNIFYNDKELKKMDLDVYRNTNIGIVFQSYNLLPHLTAEENIILSMDISKVKVKNKNEKAVELMQSVGLSKNLRSRRVLKLSGGEQQRVAIARSLANNPQLIIADEPTGNLDEKNEKIIFEIFRKLANDGKLVIVVSHSDNIVKYADVVLYMKNGRLGVYNEG